jgi:hypothetical protein
MVHLSCARRLCTRSVGTGPVALAAFLILVISYPAGGSPLNVRARPELRQTPTTVAPADTDWISDSLNAERLANRRGGYLVTEDQLDQEQEFPLSSVLVAHIPGLRVVHGPQFDMVARGINLKMNGTPCYVQMFMNGVYVADGDVDLVNVRDLSAIEYRAPGNVPVQYQNRLPGAACGVLLLWTKYS